jgi:hypothetical protein
MAVCEFGILMWGYYYIRKTGLQKFLAIHEFGGESRGNKTGFTVYHNLFYMIHTFTKVSLYKPKILILYIP